MPTQDTEVIEAELAPIISSGPRAVMQTPKQLRSQMERDNQVRAIIAEYIKANMVEGKDYGTITISGHVSKPSLFKPGAEKFCGLFKIRPTFRRDEETVEMLGNTSGILAYVCELVDGQGRVIGEGRGTAKTDPVNGKDFDINKQVKIAQKRAQIDAVLRTGALSDFFTQDMEDAPRDTEAQSSVKPRHATMKQIELMFNKVKWGAKIYDKDEVIAYLDGVLGKSLDQVMMSEVDEALEKIDKAIREDKVMDKASDLSPDQPVDEAVTEIPDNINLDNVPY